jgi:hypothetical protein
VATHVYKQEEITLQDETVVVLKPLPIAKLRRFMEAWGKFGDVTNEEEGFNVFVNCAGIALESNYKGKFDSLKASKDESEAGEFLSAEYKEYLEETLDLDSIYKILEVCGGLKLNDPKLMEAAEEILREQARDQAGKN